MKVSNFSELLYLMQSTEQMKGLSVHEHGIMVRDEYLNLIQDLNNGIGDEVLLKVYDKIRDTILPDDIVLRYQEFHDCGKPLCKIVDADGKVHFPNHAEVSSNVWKELFPEET